MITHRWILAWVSRRVLVVFCECLFVLSLFRLKVMRFCVIIRRNPFVIGSRLCRCNDLLQFLVGQLFLVNRRPCEWHRHRDSQQDGDESHWLWN